MKDFEIVKDMYLSLNLIVNEINSIGINKLDDAEISIQMVMQIIKHQNT
jgi:hypothetical protein